MTETDYTPDKETLDKLAELSIYFNLLSHTDLELIILKGHLSLEIILDSVLEERNIKNLENYSFHRKVNTLGKLEVKNTTKRDLVVSFLKEINTIRNKLAHEFDFDINKEGLESWALNVLGNLKGQKFTRYTFKTKIVHSFSVLSKNMLELIRH